MQWRNGHNPAMALFPPPDSPELKRILRPAREPVRHVDDALVHSLVLADPAAYLKFMENGLRQITAGRMQLTLPAKSVFADGPGRGDFRVMPCVTQSAGRIVKSVKVVGTNLAQRNVPDQLTVGKSLLLHPEENYVSHVFDANALSSIRTGACVALGTRLLAAQRRRLLFAGAGRVGFYSAVLCLALGQIESMRFSDPVHERAASLARFLADRHPAICFTAGPPEDGQADVVILATSSSAAFCRPPGWGAQLVISVGADTDYQSELDAAWAGRADIVLDTLDSARLGDLRSWLEEGRIRKEDLRDLFDILRRPQEAAGPVLFVSTGSALFDNLTMAYLAERLPPERHSSETKSSSL
ncbi:MAG: hypothetical protein HS112_14635 [Zoogloeaceae bacterium]|nr:hypothetical protein [Zoogloeaceae bacterium]